MNTVSRWIALSTLVAASGLQAFTDTNAEMKERVAELAARQGELPAQALARSVWVPPTAKALDGFRPVYPERGRPGDGQRLAQAVSQSRLR